MEIKEVSIPYKKSNADFHLYCLGDIHAGTIHCVEKHIIRKVNEIKQSPNTYWIGMGDYAEWITPSDKRFDPAQKSIADWVEPDNIAHCEVQWLTDLLSPIKDKCIGLLYGNHENSIRVWNHDNVQKNLCDALGVDNLGYSAFVKLRFYREKSNDSHVITGAFTHGSSGAITEGAKLMALMRWMKAMDADIYGYAHIHDYIPKSLSRITSNDGKIKSKVSIGATTGSWFRTYTKGIIASYGEQKTYPPCEIGCAMFLINPNTGSLDVQFSR